MIQQKEEDMARISAELGTSKVECGALLKEIGQLEAKIATLTSQLQAARDDRTRSDDSRSRLQEELDELRAMLQTKVTEETRRSEVDKSKEAELVDLRMQVTKLSSDLGEARKEAVEGQSQLKVELESLLREYRSLEQSHESLSGRETTAQARLKKAEAALSDAEKSKRAIESDLQVLRSRQIDLDDQLALAVKEREVGIQPDCV
jgi:myosin heavy chain 9/10/11/14